jgi:hypothetical protein
LKIRTARAVLHEIKHDGYRLIVRRDGSVVRLFTRRGHDWTDRYPAIATAAGKLRARSFTMDGEAVVVGVDGVAIFDALHRRRKAIFFSLLFGPAPAAASAHCRKSEESRYCKNGQDGRGGYCTGTPLTGRWSSVM